MAQIQPFPYETLKNYAAAEAGLLSWLHRTLPPSGYELILSSRLVEVSRKYLGASFSVHYESVYESDFSRFVEGLPEKFVCAAVSLDRLPKPVLIELDDQVALTLIDRILGGSGQAKRVPGPLTALEEGILQFFFVKLLHEISNFSGILPKPTLNKIMTRAPQLGGLNAPETRMVLLTFRLQIQNQDGYLRFAVPQEIIWPLREKIDAFTAQSLGGSEPSRLKDRLRRFEGIKTVVWAEAGTVSLSAEDLEQIERGDIILLDESYPDFDGQQVSGNVMIRIGQNVPGGIEAGIVANQGVLQVKVESIFQD